MLAHFERAYAGTELRSTNQLVAMAAAHHRLAWIHPFGDGNGRVTRLYSHAWIARSGIDARGLWTLSRGLARQRKEYFAALGAADQKRWNDLDGRGNLSDRALAEFCLFMLKTMADQIEFMTGLFQFDTLATRIDRHVRFELVKVSGRNQERLSRLLKAALIEGQIDRGRVGEIVGLRGTAARQVIRLAVSEGLLDSPSEKGPLSIVFSAKTLESYFPRLYLDLDLDMEIMAARAN
jgi:Fic family protein